MRCCLVHLCFTPIYHSSERPMRTDQSLDSDRDVRIRVARLIRLWLLLASAFRGISVLADEHIPGYVYFSVFERCIQVCLCYCNQHWLSFCCNPGNLQMFVRSFNHQPSGVPQHQGRWFWSPACPGCEPFSPSTPTSSFALFWSTAFCIHFCWFPRFLCCSLRCTFVGFRVGCFRGFHSAAVAAAAAVCAVTLSSHMVSLIF